MRRNVFIRYFVFIASLTLTLFFVSNAFAQSGTATVRGTVSDPQGNAVAGATVTLKNESKNFERTQTTNNSGGYVFTLVPPGTFTLTAETSGFKKAIVSNVQALVDTPLDVNVSLEVGTVNETVTIASTSEAIVNKTDATIGTTFESRRIAELPLNARNVVGLLSLQPGVNPTGEVNGGRRDQANVTLDGVDNNEQQTGLDIVSGNAFGSVLRVTPDSIQEFRVTTSNPNADQGRTSGAQVSLVTKSGTNDFHGSLYEYHRNTATTTNDYFNNAQGRFVATDDDVINGRAKVGDIKLPRPKLIRNVFGGSIGGPIIKDKFFFFYTYEGRRDAEELSVIQPVPTATLRQGIVRYAIDPNGTPLGVGTTSPCPTIGNPSRVCRSLSTANIATLYPATGGVNPIGLAFLQTAPLPNDFSTGDGLNVAGFRFNAPIKTELNTHIARFDYVINPNQTLYLRGNYQNDLYGQAPQFPNAPSPSLWVHPKGFVAGHIWTINSSLVNQVRFGVTRQSFSQQGDSDQNSVIFRFVYQPVAFVRTLSRTTPVYNITDDLSWSKGTHTIQFGTNLRFIRNNRTTFANAYDAAVINPSYYSNNGSSLSAPLTDLSSGAAFNTRAAVASVLGRFSEYTFNSNFNKDGSLAPVGSPSERTFATEEYEFYAQDNWRITQNLTLNYGVRWGFSTPVYETNGFQVTPTVSLNDFFRRRIEAADAGRSLNELITLDLAGPANGKSNGFYKTDLNNFAPSISVAWSPDFGDNWFGRIFGRQGKSVLRGGFRTVYDRIGSALAVSFDLNNALGFSSANTIGPNIINTTTRPGPLFTGLGQSYRGFPFLATPTPITFPLSQPGDDSLRIEQTIDDALVTPKQYTWNFTYGRELPKGFSFEASYIGRKGRNLLVERDIMQFNNLRDTRSGQTWYQAAGVLADWRFRDVPLSGITPIPFFENLFSGLGNFLFNDPTLTPTQAAYLVVASGNQGGLNIPDWTAFQTFINDASPVVGPNAFFHPQYGTLSVLSSLGKADYHGATFTLRQRFKTSFLLDVNYTFARSMDDGSALESQGSLGNNLTRNSFDLSASRSVSDFDIRHNLNANWLWELPFGRGRHFLNDLPTVPNAILGGWQLTGIFRYSSGAPVGTPFDVGFWSTNWQITSWGTRLRPVAIGNNDVNGSPNLFADPVAAYQSFRNSRAGEVGERNVFRLPSFITVDAGLSKTFKMWYAESHKLQFRWEVFNVTNTQRFGVISDFSLNQNPYSGEPSPDFGRYIGSQTPIGENRPGRVMQFALRYIF